MSVYTRIAVNRLLDRQERPSVECRDRDSVPSQIADGGSRGFQGHDIASQGIEIDLPANSGKSPGQRLFDASLGDPAVNQSGHTVSSDKVRHGTHLESGALRRGVQKLRRGRGGPKQGHQTALGRPRPNERLPTPLPSARKRIGFRTNSRVFSIGYRFMLESRHRQLDIWYQTWRSNRRKLQGSLMPASEVLRPELEPLSADKTQKDDPGRATRADRAARRALPGRTETDRTRTHARLSAAESSAEVGNWTHLAT